MHLFAFSRNVVQLTITNRELSSLSNLTLPCANAYASGFSPSQYKFKIIILCPMQVPSGSQSLGSQSAAILNHARVRCAREFAWVGPKFTDPDQ